MCKKIDSPVPSVAMLVCIAVLSEDGFNAINCCLEGIISKNRISQIQLKRVRTPCVALLVCIAVLSEGGFNANWHLKGCQYNEQLLKEKAFKETELLYNTTPLTIDMAIWVVKFPREGWKYYSDFFLSKINILQGN